MRLICSCLANIIGRTCHVTSPIWSCIVSFGGPKIRVVALNFAELEMDKIVHLKLYLPLSERSKHQLSGRSKHKLQLNVSNLLTREQ